MRKTVKSSAVFGAIVIGIGAGALGWADPVGPRAVHELHEKIAPIVDNPTPDTPFYITADVTKHIESSEAALYFPQSVAEIASALQEAGSWCEILPLHLNIKACTYSSGGDEITIYMGRKFYQDPDEAYQLTYRFTTTADEGYFNAVAVADDGPMGTSDYHIDFEVLDVGGKSFARIHVSDHQSWTSSNAMRVYLHTKGKNKEGISVVGHDEEGSPVYSKGMPAVAERNLLRYYFAFAAFFDSADVADAATRHDTQLEYWFDQTEKYQQLHELDRATYFEEKRHERRNQIALQAEL
jgi:hypothetical protein